MTLFISMYLSILAAIFMEKSFAAEPTKCRVRDLEISFKPNFSLKFYSNAVAMNSISSTFSAETILFRARVLVMVLTLQFVTWISLVLLLGLKV